ncbi:MAG TPA: PDZ domain-containing protein [Verrucomicrobiae bacterium]|nr:PDZ domain-containing protein [Verrucomicrobiae bacterium]
MNIQSIVRFQIVAGIILVSGCASSPKEKPIQQRGWIGGSYQRAAVHQSFADQFFTSDHSIYCFPPALAPKQKAGILMTDLATNSPAFRAGLRAGDLILGVDGQPVTDLQDFLRIVTTTGPGGSLAVKAFRQGKTIECTVTAGREKYRDGGSIVVALPGFFEPLRLVPTRNSPNFSLVALGYKQEAGSPFEFDTVKEQYRRNCHPKDKQKGYDPEWRMWLAIVQVSKGKTILAQEPIVASVKD